jgi:hypothetical protein
MDYIILFIVSLMDDLVSLIVSLMDDIVSFIGAAGLAQAVSNNALVRTSVFNKCRFMV